MGTYLGTKVKNPENLGSESLRPRLTRETRHSKCLVLRRTGTEYRVLRSTMAVSGLPPFKLQCRRDTNASSSLQPLTPTYTATCTRRLYQNCTDDPIETLADYQMSLVVLQPVHAEQSAITVPWFLLPSLLLSHLIGHCGPFDLRRESCLSWLPPRTSFRRHTAMYVFPSPRMNSTHADCRPAAGPCLRNEHCRRPYHAATVGRLDQCDPHLEDCRL
jgi:hypothetical protein